MSASRLSRAPWCQSASSKCHDRSMGLLSDGFRRLTVKGQEAIAAARSWRGVAATRRSTGAFAALAPRSGSSLPTGKGLPRGGRAKSLPVARPRAAPRTTSRRVSNAILECLLDAADRGARPARRRLPRSRPGALPCARAGPARRDHSRGSRRCAVGSGSPRRIPEGAARHSQKFGRDLTEGGRRPSSSIPADRPRRKVRRVIQILSGGPRTTRC